MQRDLVQSSVLLVPVVGVLVVSLNLLVQTRGNQSLVLSILQYLPVSTLAFLFLTSLYTFVLLGTAIGLSTVTSDNSYPVHVRTVAANAQRFTLIVGFFALPASLAVAAPVIAYLTWRLELYRPSVKVLTMDAWFSHASAPVDGELRRLWLEGRRIFRAKGIAIKPARHFDKQVVVVQRELGEVISDVGRRQKAMNEAGRKNGYNAVFSVCLAIFAAYGINIFATPIKFAPLESVVIDDGKPAVGYLLNANSSFLFVDRTLTNSRYLEVDQIDGRERCVVDRTWWNATVIGLAVASSTQIDGVDCPAGA